MYPGFFQGAKHNHYEDFGWPTVLTFDMLYGMWDRNGIAGAAVNKTARKVFETSPALRYTEKGDEEQPDETQIRQRFDDLRLWQRCADSYRRSLVGGYSGLILRLADNKRFRDPVERVPGGLLGLVELIPAWAGQLTVSTWDMDETSATYGHPKMYSFNEAEVVDSTTTGANGRNRSFEVHPDRVVIWGEEGTVHSRSLLQSGFNDLLSIEKITGAGGEGFWKNAKSAPVLELDPNTKLSEMAKSMNVAPTEVLDKMNDQVEDWQKGFDQLLLLQGIQAKTLPVTLMSPEFFRKGALENFAASVEIPVKVLVGMQTGERASSEDATEMEKTCMSRRSVSVIPNIMTLVQRLEDFNIIPQKDWFIVWEDLTEADMATKIERAHKMADVNSKMSDGGELVFLPEEIREVVGLEPIPASQAFVDKTGGSAEEEEFDQ
jgi:hypothetical protein